MAQPDDHNMERTRAEADRLLDDLNRMPASNDMADGRAKAVGSGSSPTGASPSGPSAPPASWLLLGALAFGTMVTALVLLLLFRLPDRSPSLTSSQVPSPDPPAGGPTADRQPAGMSAPSVPTPKREVSSKGQNPEFRPPEPQAQSPAEPRGAWGSASDYKFGRLPDSTYPDSCAFSETDSNGQALVSRSAVEYWACRDEGGNATDGFTVAWADGKTTKYKFGPGGTGAVIGTNGLTYPVTWRNDYRHGSKVIIISHEEGSTSWIPGHVK